VSQQHKPLREDLQLYDKYVKPSLGDDVALRGTKAATEDYRIYETFVERPLRDTSASTAEVYEKWLGSYGSSRRQLHDHNWN
jgi:hypothetical protein